MAANKYVCVFWMFDKKEQAGIQFKIAGRAARLGI